MAGYNVKGITIEIGADATLLTDKLSEISKQCAGLDRQAQQLKRALNLNGTGASVETLRVYHETLGAQIKKTKDELTAAKSAFQAFPQQVEGWKSAISQSEQNIVSLNGNITQYRNQIESLTPQQEKLSESMRKTQTSVDGYDTAIKKLEQEIFSAKTAQDQYLERMSTLHKQHQKAQESVYHLETEFDKLCKAFNEGKISEAEFNKAGTDLISQLDREQKKVEETNQGMAEHKRVMGEIEQSKKELAARTQELIAKREEEKNKLASLNSQYQKNAAEIDDTKKKIQECEEQIARENRTIEVNKEKVENADKSYLNLQSRIQVLQEKLVSLEAEQAKVEDRMNAVNQAAQKVADTMDKVSQSADTFSQRMGTIANATKWISTGSAAALGGAAAAVIHYEDAWVGVTKTVEGTPAQLAKVNNELHELALTTASNYETIAGIAEVGGQMGIATDQIAGFTKVITELSDTTNITAAEGAQTMAQFANIMMESSGRTVDYYERLGSTIVDLGNNFATTEQDIMEMAFRLASAGRSVGMTSQEVLALSTALASMGIKAAAGGSSMSKLITQIQTAVSTGSEELQGYADTAGMTADQFAKAWSDDAASAFMSFIEGIGKSSDVVARMDELGIKEVRMANGVRALAQSTDVYKDAMTRANQAYDENTAMSIEAEKRYSTLKTKINQAKEAIQQAAEALGQELVPYIKDGAAWVKDLALKFKDLDQGTKDTIVKFLAFSACISPVFKGLEKVGSAVKGTAKFIKDSTLDVAKFIVRLGSLSSTGVIAAGSIAGLSTAFIAAGVWAKNTRDRLVEYGESLDDNAYSSKRLSEQTKELVDSAKQHHETADAMISTYQANEVEAESLMKTIERLNEKEKLSTTDKFLMQDAVERLNDIYPGLNASIDENTGKLQTNTQELRNNLEETKKTAKEKAIASAVGEMNSALAKEQVAYQMATSNIDYYRDALAEAKTKLDEMRNSGTATQEELEQQTGIVEYNRQKFKELSDQLETTGSAIAESREQIMLWQNQLETGDNLSIGTSLKQSFDDAVQAASQAGFEIPQAISDGMTNGSMSVQDAARFISLLMTFQEGVDSAGMYGGMIDQELVSQLLAGAPDVATAMAELQNVIDLTDALNRTGYQGDELSRGIIQKLQGMNVDIDQISTEAAAYGGKSAEEYVNQSKDKFGNGVIPNAVNKMADDAQNNARKQFNKLPTSSSNAIVNTASQFRNDGTAPSAAYSWGGKIHSNAVSQIKIADYVHQQVVQARTEIESLNNAKPKVNTGGAMNAGASTKGKSSRRSNFIPEFAPIMSAGTAQVINETMSISQNGAIDSAARRIQSSVGNRLSSLEQSMNRVIGNDRLGRIERLLETVADNSGAYIYMDGQQVGKLTADGVRDSFETSAIITNAVKGVR